MVIDNKLIESLIELRKKQNTLDETDVIRTHLLKDEGDDLDESFIPGGFKIDLDKIGDDIEENIKKSESGELSYDEIEEVYEKLDDTERKLDDYESNLDNISEIIQIEKQKMLLYEEYNINTDDLFFLYEELIDTIIDEDYERSTEIRTEILKYEATK